MLLVFCAIYGTLAYSFLRKKDGPTGKPFSIPWVKKGSWVEVRARLLWVASRLGDGVVGGMRWMTGAVERAFNKQRPPASGA
jgi:hypothetical protein